MNIETRKIVYYRDFCYHLGINAEDLHNAICQSEISFGNNPDTLLDANAMESFIAPLGVKLPDNFDDVWFSLGC